MKKNFVYVAMLLIALLYFTKVNSAEIKKYAIEELLNPSKIGEDDFTKYDISTKILNNEFKLYEIGDLLICYYERKIKDIIVEKDHLNFQFNKESSELINKKISWRDDIKEDLLPQTKITQEEINKIALKEEKEDAEVLWSKLYIISPNSDIHRLSEATNDPCWVVWLRTKGVQKIKIYNAVSGQFLSYGIAPPATGFTFSGPWYSGPCSGSWDNWYLNAKYWFEQFGYPTVASMWPSRIEIQRQVENSDSKLFYEVAHGNSDTFASGCVDDQSFEFTYAYDIRNWISHSLKKSFIFLGSCEGMCYTGSNTFSYEFRKGSYEETVSIGYCGMSTQHCDSCWYVTIDWQNALFNYMKQKNTIKYSFDRASADYPSCIDPPACIRFAGDENYTLPVKEYMLLKKLTPHIEINWYPPSTSNIYYKLSLNDELQVLFNGVIPTVNHINALIDNNNYYYIFEPTSM